ncbi:MAG: UpxY family transcription antiterminator [Deltaproteobacteria bacterium]|nr:UpxY family transcription antiterminator [Deltaproteobacteria bacterium]
MQAKAIGSASIQRSEGGEALAAIITSEAADLEWQSSLQDQPQESADRQWYALWTRSHCENLVCDQLAAKGFRPFLPIMSVWSRRGGLRQLSQVPLFPGYLFLRHAMDKSSYIEVRKSRGLVAILGERWDRLAVIPDEQIEAIRKVLRAQLPAVSHPYLREGQRVRIARGPLKDVEGILVRIKSDKGLLVVSIELLKRSIAVEVDCTLVAPA